MKEILELIKTTLDKNKGEDIKVIDVSSSSPVCDYFVIVSVNNQRHINSLAQKTKETLDKANHSIRSMQGKESNWFLIDANQIIIHIFQKDEREKYKLEDLWIKNSK